MASVEFGGGVSQIVGRVGGSVFQRGRAGSQLRTLPINTGRKQQEQNYSRSNYAATSTTWRTLQDFERLAWNAFALTEIRYNRFGVPYTPSGFQMFMEYNVNRSYVKPMPAIATPDALVPVPYIGGLGVTIDTSIPAFGWTGTLVNDNGTFQWMVQATRPQGQGVFRNRQSFLTVREAGAADALPTDVWSSYTKAIGFDPLLEQVVFVRVAAFSPSTGQRGPWETVRVITT